MFFFIGHESFTNLRSRGSSLCDLAILVVDIMHGLEPQTLESINLLKERQAPFVVALNKIDRLFEWKSNPVQDIRDTIKKQKKHTRDEFEARLKQIISEFAVKCLLNVIPFWDNEDPANYVSICPTSAHTGKLECHSFAKVLGLFEIFDIHIVYHIED